MPTTAASSYSIYADPGELSDLAADPKFALEVKKWRKRLTEFLAERGPAWVTTAILCRGRRVLYSPNYPGSAK